MNDSQISTSLIYHACLDDIVTLGVESNRLVGTIPTEFGQLQSLGTFWSSVYDVMSTFGYRRHLTLTILVCMISERLYLDDNQFWGTIPTEFSNLERLEVMDLSYNDFYGTISEEICSIDDIRIILADCEGIECSCCLAC